MPTQESPQDSIRTPAPTDPVKTPYPTDLASLLAQRLRSAKIELVTRWLDRITARVTLPAVEVFPTEGSQMSLGDEREGFVCSIR